MKTKQPEPLKTIIVSVVISEYKIQENQFYSNEVYTGDRKNINISFPNNKKGNKECFDFLKNTKESFDKLPEMVRVIYKQLYDLSRYAKTAAQKRKEKELEMLIKTLPKDLSILRQKVTIETV